MCASKSHYWDHWQVISSTSFLDESTILSEVQFPFNSSQAPSIGRAQRKTFSTDAAPLQFVSFVSFEQTKVCSQCGQDGVGALNNMDRT
jgi:hypothetical protein